MESFENVICLGCAHDDVVSIKRMIVVILHSLQQKKSPLCIYAKLYATYGVSSFVDDVRSVRILKRIYWNVKCVPLPSDRLLLSAFYINIYCTFAHPIINNLYMPCHTVMIYPLKNK